MDHIILNVAEKKMFVFILPRTNQSVDSHYCTISHHMQRIEPDISLIRDRAGKDIAHHLSVSHKRCKYG